jgi:hypothetical protein
MGRYQMTTMLPGCLLAITLVMAGSAVMNGSATVARAQDSAETDDTVGRAMHDYYAQNYRSAHGALSKVIQAGSQDPRVFYFRGLCYLNLGREAEAKADFFKGATIEANDSQSFYDVGRSLERVQGNARQLVEDHRTDARAAVAGQLERRRAMYRPRPRSEAAANSPPSKTTPAPLDSIPPGIEIPLGIDPVGGPSSTPGAGGNAPTPPAATNPFGT